MYSREEDLFWAMLLGVVALTVLALQAWASEQIKTIHRYPDTEPGFLGTCKQYWHEVRAYIFDAEGMSYEESYLMYQWCEWKLPRTALVIGAEQRLAWALTRMRCTWLAVKLAFCYVAGHEIEDDSWGGSESGGMAGHCTRCGWSFHHTLY